MAGEPSALFVFQVGAYPGTTSGSTVSTPAVGGSATWTMNADGPLPFLHTLAQLSAVGVAGRFVQGIVTAVDEAARQVTVQAHVTTGNPGGASSWVLDLNQLYFSSDPFATEPGETPSLAGGAALRFEPRVIQAAEITRRMFGRGATGGASALEVGDVVLSNADGHLDRLLDYGLDGRSVACWIAQWDESAKARPTWPGEFTQILAGTVAAASTGDGGREFVLSLRTGGTDLEAKPVQSARYAGTNALPAGVEGTEDVKGRVKPMVWGRTRNAGAVLVNTSKLIYQVHAGAVSNISSVRDRGAELGKGADYTSQADMEGTAPAAGQFRQWKPGGMFRLGSNPAGQITAWVDEQALAADRTAAALMDRIATAAGTTPVAQDISDLQAANAAEVELFLGEEASVAETLDRLAVTVGAWWGFNRLGQLRIQRLAAPTGSGFARTFRRAAGTESPLATDESDILDLEVYPPADQPNGLPVAEVVLSYGPNPTVQESDLAGSVPADWRNFVRYPSRDTDPAVSTATKTLHPLAGKLRIETLFAVAGSGSVGGSTQQRDRILALRRVRRDRVVLRTRLDAATALLDLNAEVRVIFPRFGYDAGRAFRIVGTTTDARARLLTLELWG